MSFIYLEETRYDNSNKIISFAFDLDSKVILNHKQNDIQNMKQSVDILKSKSYDKTSILLQFVSEFISLFSHN
jgi:hypothetical protein